MMYAISLNGKEPARNIPQDTKMWNNRFYKCNRHSGRFMEGAMGLYPLPPLANSSRYYSVIPRVHNMHTYGEEYPTQ